MPWAEVHVDLPAQTVTCSTSVHPFDIAPEPKQMLLEGLDAIDLTLKSRPAIDAWTREDRAARPWVYLEKLA
jgi:3-isopropylmalate/(R)-2-methylmalate dehydratase small subunit